MKKKETPKAQVMVPTDNNKLEVYSSDGELKATIDRSGLVGTKAQALLDNFAESFRIADEWEIKARSIVVTDVSQTAEMKMARVGRLFIREHRVEIEKMRVKLKADSLREGQAIDAIAKILKGVFAPIEDHLTRQERFAEIQEEKAAEEARLETRARLAKEAEEKRVADEKAEVARQAKIRKDNAALRKKAAVADKKLEEERAAREAERQEAAAAKEEADHKAEVAREKARKDDARKAAVAKSKADAAAKKASDEKKRADEALKKEQAAKKKAEDEAADLKKKLAA